MACVHFEYLQKRIDALKAKFVQAQLEEENREPLSYIPDTDSLAAFRLLAHAEIEDYLERKATQGLSRIEYDFSGGRKAIRECIDILVVALTLIDTLKQMPRLESPHWESDVARTIKHARDSVRENNGIKEYSFARLAVFAGKMPDEIDNALVASLTSYGSSRGDVAHQSAARVTTILAPSAEAKAVDDILKQLEGYFS